MRKLLKKLLSPINLYVALALLAANGLAWAAALAPSGPAYVAEPLLEPSLADLRARLREGGHGGERFDLEVTDREAAESIAWFLSNHPEIPFRNPHVAFHPDVVEAWGEVDVLGLRLSVHGVATMVLGDGIPVVTLTDLGVAGAPVPRPILEAVQEEFYKQVDLSNREMPIVFDTVDAREGEVTASGTIR